MVGLVEQHAVGAALILGVLFRFDRNLVRSRLVICPSGFFGRFKSPESAACKGPGEKHLVGKRAGVEPLLDTCAVALQIVSAPAEQSRQFGNISFKPDFPTVDTVLKLHLIDPQMPLVFG